MLPLIAIPTTGGTGSECQSFALITDETTHQKMACGDPKAAARVAVLDPGLDSLATAARHRLHRHRRRRARGGNRGDSQAHSPLRTLLARSLQTHDGRVAARARSRPDDLEARGWMLLGAAWAGTAIENSMLGAAHSAANPLTAHYGIVHGHAVG